MIIMNTGTLIRIILAEGRYAYYIFSVLDLDYSELHTGSPSWETSCR